LLSLVVVVVLDTVVVVVQVACSDLAHRLFLQLLTLAPLVLAELELPTILQTQEMATILNLEH
jgi:hypothetical protein